MVRVLVLGATGYIGFPLAQSLRRDAHKVYGLVRSTSKVKQLQLQEIIPVVGTVEAGEYLDVVRRDNIDIVVDATGAHPGSGKWFEGLKALSAQRLRTRGPAGPKLGFISVSGTWVHGSSRREVNDLNPVGVETDEGCPEPPVTLTAWRSAYEQAVLASRDVMDTAVMRPALVYGGPGNNGKLWSLWFDPIHSAASNLSTRIDEVHVAANANAKIGLVHVDDVTSALHLAVAKFSLLNTASGTHPIFDIVSSSELLKPILEEAAEVMGYKKQLVYDGPRDDPFTQAMNTSMVNSSTRLRDLLGWTPKFNSMQDNMEPCVLSWKAGQ